jgi:hypothetical protein
MAAAVTLLSGAQTASGTLRLGEAGFLGSAAPGTTKTPEIHLNSGAVFQLAVTAATALTSLDVKLQHSVDGGTTWDDFVRFAQVTSAPLAAPLIAQWLREGFAPAAGVHASSTSTLASNAVLQGPLGDDWQIVWTLVGTSVTFSVLGRYFKRVR